MFVKLYRNLVKKRKSQPVHKQDVSATSVWQDTGRVYYLENTLKLSYQSKAGKVTFEQLSLGSLPDLIEHLHALDQSQPLSSRNTAGQKDAYSLSICGVTWQTNGETTRIKAIPDAALLRSQTACFSRSQAIFKHAIMLEHEDILSQRSSGEGVYSYNRISIEQFTEQIALANARLSDRSRGAIPIKPDNFETGFTPHEQAVIDALLLPGSDNSKKLT